MTTYDKAKIKALIDDEHGQHYCRNIPLDGFTITLSDAFISFCFREIDSSVIAVISYIYVTSKEDLISLLGYCINLWSGYNVKMIYYREHKRKSNIIKLLKYLDFDVTSIKKNNWKYKWTSTNGFKEDDCIEAFTRHRA